VLYGVQALQCKVTVQEMDPILSDVIVLHNDVKRILSTGICPSFYLTLSPPGDPIGGLFYLRKI